MKIEKSELSEGWLKDLLTSKLEEYIGENGENSIEEEDGILCRIKVSSHLEYFGLKLIEVIQLNPNVRLSMTDNASRIECGILTLKIKKWEDHFERDFYETIQSCQGLIFTFTSFEILVCRIQNQSLPQVKLEIDKLGLLVTGSQVTKEISARLTDVSRQVTFPECLVTSNKDDGAEATERLRRFKLDGQVYSRINDNYEVTSSRRAFSRLLTRSMTIVPDDQMKLLGMNSCWFPPSDKEEFPIPNIPDDVFEELLTNVPNTKKKPDSTSVITRLSKVNDDKDNVRIETCYDNEVEVNLSVAREEVKSEDMDLETFSIGTESFPSNFSKEPAISSQIDEEESKAHGANDDCVACYSQDWPIKLEDNQLPEGSVDSSESSSDDLREIDIHEMNPITGVKRSVSEVITNNQTSPSQISTSTSSKRNRFES